MSLYVVQWLTLCNDATVVLLHAVLILYQYSTDGTAGYAILAVQLRVQIQSRVWAKDGLLLEIKTLHDYGYFLKLPSCCKNQEVSCYGSARF